jgi:hypothetical protein
LVQDQRKANTAKKSRSNGRYDQEAMDKRWVHLINLMMCKLINLTVTFCL